MSPVFMCCSEFDMYTTLFKVALFPSSSYNLMLASIMTVVVLLLLFIPPPPHVSGNNWDLILASLVNYAFKTDDIHEI
jgi:hypothetical protein